MPTVITEEGLAVCTPCLTGVHQGCRKDWVDGTRSQAIQRQCACQQAAHSLGPTEPVGEVKASRVHDEDLPSISDRPKCVTEIPKFLRHLPTDRRGFPVPYVSEWHDESAEANLRRIERGEQVGGRFEKAYIAGSPWPVTLLSPSGTKGVGAPRLASLHPVRQRECVLKRRCQVCGRKIAPTSTVLLIGGERHENASGNTVVAFREPPVHPRCGVFALFACPGINRSQVFVGETRDYLVVPYSKQITQHNVDGSVDTEPVIRFVPHSEGYLEYLLAVLPDDAHIYVNPESYRETHAHLLK